MYNQELKERFIREFAYTDSVRKSCAKTFERAGQIEESVGADFCTMDLADARSVLDSVGSLKGNNARVNILFAYVRWCEWHKVPNVNMDILNESKQSYTKIRQKMVSGPFHLQMCLDQIFEPESAQTADNMYRCFCWFAFMGMTQRTAMSITSGEVDFDDMVIRHELRSYPIYRESLPTLRQCATMTEILIPAVDSSVRCRPRAYGDEMLRGLYGVQTINTLRATLAAKRKDKLDLGMDVSMFTYNSLTLSGAFYRIYEMERAGIAPDMSQLAAQTMDGRTYKLAQRLTLNGKQNQLATAYLEDYYAWKQVFC